MTCRTIYWISNFEWTSMNKSISITNEVKTVYQKNDTRFEIQIPFKSKKGRKKPDASFFALSNYLTQFMRKNGFEFYFCRLEINSNECRGEMLPLNVENVGSYCSSNEINVFHFICFKSLLLLLVYFFHLTHHDQSDYFILVENIFLICALVLLLNTNSMDSE